MKNLLVLLFLCLVNLIYAQESAYISYTNKPLMTTSSVMRLVTAEATSTSDTNQVFDRSAAVHLIYGREDHSDTGNKTAWGFKVAYELTYLALDSTVNDTLELMYSPGSNGIYEAMALYGDFSTGEVELSITGLWASVLGYGWVSYSDASSISLIPNDIRLELRMNETQYNYLNPSYQLLTGENYVYQNTGTKESSIDIYWDFVPGMEAVEIEYAFWDSLITDQPAGTTDPDIWKMGVRIETPEQHYRLELTYPGGTLYYRVRPIGRFIRDVAGNYEYRKEGAWSTVSSVAITSFDPTRNWQYSTVYAEDGKNKKVISYFDESMRARQVVTFLNDDQRTLVGETDYSLEGQAVLSILPVPSAASENNLFFKANFNQNSSGDAYSYLDFDNTSGASTIKNTTGAGYYYSTANASSSDIYSAYIPDAGGYPMSQMRYKRDGTGRVEVQGGVGDFYQLGAGRETRYLYGSASEVELRRLFGSGVGIAGHYEKHVSIDANGQSSIAYVDQAGQTIATALAGANPSNVQALDSMQNDTITVDMIPNQGPVVDNAKCLDYTLTHYLESPINYHFEYDMQGVYNYFSHGGQGICESCRYGLEIQVFNPDGESMSPLNLTNGSLKIDTTIVDTVTTYEYTVTEEYEGSALSCTGIDSFSNSALSFDLSFEVIGEYRVVKCLRLLSALSPEELLDSLEANNMLPSIGDYMPAIDSSQCVFYNTSPDSTFLDSIFNAVNEGDCESMLEQMKRQIRPDGVFSPISANYLDVGQIYNVEDINGDHYELTIGLSGTIWMDVSYPVAYSGGDIFIENRAGGTHTINVNGSGDFFVPDFIAALNDADLYQSDWIDTLVTGHREYCHYQACICHISSDNFDMLLSTYHTWEDWSSSMDCPHFMRALRG